MGIEGMVVFSTILGNSDMFLLYFYTQRSRVAECVTHGGFIPSENWLSPGVTWYDEI